MSIAEEQFKHHSLAQLFSRIAELLSDLKKPILRSDTLYKPSFYFLLESLQNLNWIFGQRKYLFYFESKWHVTSREKGVVKVELFLLQLYVLRKKCKDNTISTIQMKLIGICAKA